MPTKNGRGLDEQGCFAPSWRDSRGENNREALPGRPPDAPGKLPLGDDELLSKKRVLGDQFDATANEIRGQSGNESKKVDHASSLTPSARMQFVARTGAGRPARRPSASSAMPAGIASSSATTVALPSGRRPRGTSGIEARPGAFRQAGIDHAGEKMINVDEGGWPIRGESIEEC